MTADGNVVLCTDSLVGSRSSYDRITGKLGVVSNVFSTRTVNAKTQRRFSHSVTQICISKQRHVYYSRRSFVI